ncbi:MAG: DUF2752 domain-containing protein [Planctomycetota bacterium]
MPQLRMQDRLTTFFKLLGLGSLTGYISWNAYWLAHGRLAPSIWAYVTGLPCPSSGMTRSVEALVDGRFADFILYNTFTIPVVLLLMYSACQLFGSWKKKRDIALPSFLGWLWLVTILGAWLSKFLVGRQYW